MTEAQHKALVEAKRLLEAHFDAYVLSTRTADENLQDEHNTDWHGSLADVIGLNRITEIRLGHIALSAGKPL